MDDQAALAHPHLFARGRDTSQLFLNQSADRVGILVQADLEKIVDAPHLRPSVHQDLILSDPFDQLLRDIGLVHDLADHLFQEVLERDQTHHPAELVHHDGHVSLFLLELLQELIGLFRGRHEERRMRDLLEPDIIMPLSQVHQRLGLVENPDDVVQAPVEQRDAGKLRLEELLFQSKFSRIPLFDGSLDNIIGILYKTKALMDLAQGHDDVRLKKIAHPALFVPAAKQADELLKQFQQEQRHMAIVVNEFGGVMGLVTLEDLLEEVVGEIMDETDITEELIKRIGKNQILVHGRTEVRRINDFLKVSLDENANTISGLIQEQLGRIPAAGEEVRVGQCRLVVHEADPKSIKSVQIVKEEKAPAPAGSAGVGLPG